MSSERTTVLESAVDRVLLGEIILLAVLLSALVTKWLLQSGSRLLSLVPNLVTAWVAYILLAYLFGTVAIRLHSEVSEDGE